MAIMNFQLSDPTVVLPDWPGQPAHQLLAVHLRCRTLPSTPGTTGFLQGDAIIALAADDPPSRALAAKLSVRLDDLPEGAFAVVPQSQRGAAAIKESPSPLSSPLGPLGREGRVSGCHLFALGGDKRGLLTGLAAMMERAQVDGDSLTWTHDELRERPALPRNYYWTWDHSTNWWLSAEGQQESGCNNIYTKTAEDFVRDYKLLVDHCLRSRVGGIVIWGFVRDAHGGVSASQEVANYAADRGIRILPGVGTCVYGGAHYVCDYETDTSKPLSARGFVHNYPDSGMVGHDGKRSALYPCPTHPDTIAWLKDCAAWLFDTFRIGGVNIEHGDFIVCHCERCASVRKGHRQAAYFSTMQLANQPFIEEALRLRPDAWITYATYTGFAPDPTPETGYTPTSDWTVNESWRLHGENPEFVQAFDPRSICQWTLTNMVHDKQLPLLAWLDDGKPEAMLRSEHWPAGHKPPTKRSAGFLHQASQWNSRGERPTGLPARYTVQISCIKEACLRAAGAGFEGVSIHGEVSTRCIPWALNYAAFAYFSYHPEATLREFGRAMLGPAFGSDAEGERFVEWLAKAEAGTCSPDDCKEIEQRRAEAARRTIMQGASTLPARYWQWLRVAAEPGQWPAAQVYQISA